MTKRQPTIGTSFSLHRCSELGLNKKAVLNAALTDLGIKRFRLMSYWNIHEPRQGQYDFTELDWQLNMINKYGGNVTLCLGKRQPRWPECHMPDWALKLPKEEWYEALYAYIATIVNRYKDHPALHSYQLENEALLKDFGDCRDGDYSHERLEHEYRLVKKLDPYHPVIMTLSDSWGLPMRRPHPDMYAMSMYRITINMHGTYAYSKRPASFYKSRIQLIKLLTRKQTFIHELQTEPWLADAITNVSVRQQLKYMDSSIVKSNIDYARSINVQIIDLWGLEWWFWLKSKHDKPEIWNYIRTLHT